METRRVVVYGGIEDVIEDQIPNYGCVTYKDNGVIVTDCGIEEAVVIKHNMEAFLGSLKKGDTVAYITEEGSKLIELEVKAVKKFLIECP